MIIILHKLTKFGNNFVNLLINDKERVVLLTLETKCSKIVKNLHGGDKGEQIASFNTFYVPSIMGYIKHNIFSIYISKN